jgi:hypothetical protein
MDHHNHQSHNHDFINKHTAFAILVLIVVCFIAGYLVGRDGKTFRRSNMHDWSQSEIMFYKF